MYNTGECVQVTLLILRKFNAYYSYENMDQFVCQQTTRLLRTRIELVQLLVRN